MKKRQIYILAAILLPLALIYYYFFYLHSAVRLTELAVAANDPAICHEANEAEFMSGASREDCYYQVASVHNNITACNYSVSSKDLCFETVAAGLKDETVCDKIGSDSDQSRRNECKKSVRDMK